MWLQDGRSLYDTFGFGWTLLRLGSARADVALFVAAAAQLGIELKVVDCDDEEAYDLYESDLALVRPDQVVAWRRTDRTDIAPQEVIERAIGLHSASA